MNQEGQIYGIDAAGLEVPAVSEFLREMAACDASPTTLRSYSYELLSGCGSLPPLR